MQGPVRATVTIPDDLPQRLDDPTAALPDLPDGLRFAAVIGLMLRESTGDPDPRLLLIERSGSLRTHAGQVAFPGGKPEPEDPTLVDTALREATEEVGLPRAEASVLGRLSPVPTPSGFLVVPFVGWAPTGWQPRATSPEVHRILTPRIRQLADPAIHHVTAHHRWRGRPYAMHEFRVHEPPIWGATALMVHELLRRMELVE